MRYTFLLSLLALTFSAFAETPSAPVEPDFDSLGGNTILLERARALEPDKSVSIIQQRTVSRRNRLELAPEFSGTFGGEAYARTKSLGLNLNYHFTPRFSVGVKYNYSFNTLTPEGEALVDQAYADYLANPSNPNKAYPELDWAKSEWIGALTWYPVYGKLNFFDQSVVHFDLYTLAGAGQVSLRSGPTTSYTAGIGSGFWMSQNFTTRIEMRWQRYTAQYFSGPRELDLAIGSLQMGWML